MKQSNVIQFVSRSENYNEDVVMVQNLQQMINVLVLRHGAHLVLENLPSMVQAAQAKARANFKTKTPKQKKVAGRK